LIHILSTYILSLEILHYTPESKFPDDFGQLKEAQEIQEKVLEETTRTLGEDHPDTLRSVQILANTYRQLGGRLLEEAQELEEEVLEVRRRTLGEEHPDTLRSMRNLVITYRQLRGRLKEAQELEEKVRFVRMVER
jgi:NTP pyrophosphatase (non-canonical NTP hydrolase)